MDKLFKKVLEFRDAREWKQFHTIKNLSAALNVEAAELLEITQWNSDSEVTERLKDPKVRSSFKNEIGDVLIYLVLIAHEAKIDLIEAALEKIELNESKYPADRVRGQSLKYTEYE